MGNVEYLFIAITPRSTKAGGEELDRVLIELFDI